MDTQLFLICFLTFVIHLIGTLAYSVRIAGVRTKRIVEGKVSEGQFRKAIVWLVGSRLAGTVAAQALLLPAAMLIAAVARII